MRPFRCHAGQVTDGGLALDLNISQSPVGWKMRFDSLPSPLLSLPLPLDIMIVCVGGGGVLLVGGRGYKMGVLFLWAWLVSCL